MMISASAASYAQKFAFVDSQYILDNITEYQMAQNQLDELAKTWQKEIDAKIADIDKLYKAYQADAVLLPEDLKRKREDGILNKEKEVKQLQQKRFSTDGDLYKKRAELVKPIQDKVYNAIEELAKEKGYSVMFDRSGSGTILYADAKFDKSDEILQKLGYTPANKTTTNSSSKQQESTEDEDNGVRK